MHFAIKKQGGTQTLWISHCHSQSAGTAVWETGWQLYGTAQKQQAISHPMGKCSLLRNKKSFCSVLAWHIHYFLHCFMIKKVNALARNNEVLKNLKATIRKLLFLQIISDGINFCLWVSIIIWCLGSCLTFKWFFSLFPWTIYASVCL